LEESGGWSVFGKVWVRNGERNESLICVGMIARTLRSSRRRKSVVKGEQVQSELRKKRKRGVHDERRQ
jgi:hypothetical protein